MSETSTPINVTPHVEPKKNFMWALCNTTMDSQLSEGAVLASNSLLGEAVTKMMNALSKAFIGEGGSFSPSTDPTSDKDFGNHTLDWYVQEMQYLAGQASKDTNQKLGFEMSFCQQTYSLKNTSMQEQVNVLNNGSQSESQQSQQDNSNLQSLVTLASTGNGAATYAANLMQQTMA